MLTSHHKETKQPHKKISGRLIWRGGIYRYTPVATGGYTDIPPSLRPWSASITEGALSVDGTVVEPVKSARDLGIYIDSDLLMRTLWS